MATITRTVVLEPEAQDLAAATAEPPYVFDLGPEKGREVLDQIQSGEAEKPAVEVDGGNMSVAITLLAKERSGPRLAAQVLFYPATDASFDTDSYHEFATTYFLRRDAMHWFWEQYTSDEAERNEITASSLRAGVEQLADLPPARDHRRG